MSSQPPNFPPDSRTGSTASAMIEDQTGVVRPFDGSNQPPSAMAHQQRQMPQQQQAAAQHGVNTMGHGQGGPNMDAAQHNSAALDEQFGDEPVYPGSMLQQVFGTERYFEWIDFATTQAYQGVKIEDMDRMDLMAAFGCLVGDFYTSTAQQAQSQQQPPPQQQQQPTTQQPQQQQAGVPLQQARPGQRSNYPY